MAARRRPARHAGPRDRRHLRRARRRARGGAFSWPLRCRARPGARPASPGRDGRGGGLHAASPRARVARRRRGAAPGPPPRGAPSDGVPDQASTPRRPVSPEPTDLRHGGEEPCNPRRAARPRPRPPDGPRDRRARRDHGRDRLDRSAQCSMGTCRGARRPCDTARRAAGARGARSSRAESRRCARALLSRCAARPRAGADARRRAIRSTRARDAAGRVDASIARPPARHGHDRDGADVGGVRHHGAARHELPRSQHRAGRSASAPLLGAQSAAHRSGRGHDAPAIPRASQPDAAPPRASRRDRGSDRARD